MIQSIINQRHEWGHTALDYAIELEEADSIEYMLDAGASICEGTFGAFFGEQLCTAQTLGVVRNLVESLAQQRRDLLWLALQNLTTEKLRNLGVQGDLLLDTKAFDVVKTLRQHQILVPTAYDLLTPGSVYHWSSINPCLAQHLYNAGFRETNARVYGYTPPMLLQFWHRNYIEQMYWFFDHGADLYASIPEKASLANKSTFYDSSEVEPSPVYPLIHLFAYRTGSYPKKLDGEQSSQLSRLIQDTATDTCICYCMTGDSGCTTASKYAHGAWHWGIGEDGFTEMEGMNQELLKAIWQAELPLSKHNNYKPALDIIRMITFEMLGMKHTCCSYSTPCDLENIRKYGLLRLMDPTEVEEIREEDRYLAGQLGILMKEFEVNFRDLDMLLGQFMQEYWWPRMREVKEEDKLSREDVQAIEEIGVVLDEP